MRTFRDWFNDSMLEYVEDIVRLGCREGIPKITYTSHCVFIFNEFDAEIWKEIDLDSVKYGSSNVLDYISTFTKRYGDGLMLREIGSFKQLLVFYMCEKVAKEIQGVKE